MLYGMLLIVNKRFLVRISVPSLKMLVTRVLLYNQFWGIFNIYLVYLVLLDDLALLVADNDADVVD